MNESSSKRMSSNSLEIHMVRLNRIERRLMDISGKFPAFSCKPKLFFRKHCFPGRAVETEKSPWPRSTNLLATSKLSSASFSGWSIISELLLSAMKFSSFAHGRQFSYLMTILLCLSFDTYRTSTRFMFGSDRSIAALASVRDFALFL